MKGTSLQRWSRYHRPRLSGIQQRSRRVRVHFSVAELLLPASCVAGAAGLTLSGLDLLSKVAEKSPEQRLEVDKVDEDDEFSWTVVTAVSLIPGFNWLVRCPGQVSL
jgi:hypothetical protein